MRLRDCTHLKRPSLESQHPSLHRSTSGCCPRNPPRLPHSPNLSASHGCGSPWPSSRTYVSARCALFSHNAAAHSEPAAVPDFIAILCNCGKENERCDAFSSQPESVDCRLGTLVIVFGNVRALKRQQCTVRTSRTDVSSLANLYDKCRYVK